MQNLENLLEQAIEASDSGNKEKAIKIYEKILSEKEDWSKPHYNLGLIYKYRLEWDKSYQFNKRAVELNPKDEASQWNLGIAATMLQDWRLARQCWNFFGMKYKIVDEDTAGNIGKTPIRINPNEEGEIVWATRICPARAIINNIPYPESNHRYKDIVLNDGAANGYRQSEGKEYAVLDEIQHLSKSEYQTFSIKSKLPNKKHFEELEERCEKVGIAVENWTTSVRILCKQCSEGKPHEAHDHELEKTDESLIAFASTSRENLIQILEAWSTETSNDYYESHYY
jgi:tetratricopeptide (TPR) repeat protein